MGIQDKPPADPADNTDQPDLFTQIGQPIAWAGFDVKSTTTNLPNRPTCNLCGRPAFWRPNKRQWSAYCSSQSCISRVRLCKHCGEPFNVAAANARYCSDECRQRQYRKARPGTVVTCPVDGTEHTGVNRWQLCGECYLVIRPVKTALESHHVPIDLVVGLIKNPFCPIPNCGRPLLERLERLGGAVISRYGLAVDHDHACCPGPHGCSECVRGLICWLCNIVIGQADEDVGRLRGMADYLDGWRRRA
jgi:hypothetical protein